MKLIPLSREQFALVDDEDYEFLIQRKWYAGNNPKAHTMYAKSGKGCGKNGLKILMHRLIMGANNGQFIDHIDGNGLNNQKSNLRFCTHTENMRNSKKRNSISEYKGVSWFKHARRWRARITVNKKGITIGYFKDKTHAARAYDQAAIKHYGKFARLNFQSK